MPIERKHFIIASAALSAGLAFAWYQYRREQPEYGEDATGYTSTPDYQYNEMSNTIPGTKNFRISEFACKDGTPVPVQYYGNVQTLMNNLQVLRDHLGLPIFVNSGYRTPSHNRSVGGATNSFHMRAMAADIRVPGMTAAQVKASIQDLINTGLMVPGGLKAYPSFTHYDVRGHLTLF